MHFAFSGFSAGPNRRGFGSFWGSTFLFFFLLFGGLTVTSNCVVPGATSGYAITSAKAPLNEQQQKGGIPKIPLGVIILFFVLVAILLAGIVVLNVWAVNLLIAKKFLPGLGILALELIAILAIRRRRRFGSAPR